MEITLATTDPANLFLAHLQRTMEHVLAQMETSATTIPSIQDRNLAQHGLDFALTQPQMWPLARKVVRTLAPKMEQAGHRSEWLPILQQAILMSEDLCDESTAGELHFQVGRLYQYCGEYENAKSSFLCSLTHFQSLGDIRHHGKALGRLAYLAHLQQDNHEAEMLLEQALHLLNEDEIERAGLYNVQGDIAKSRHDWEAALINYDRALALWKNVNDRRMIAWTYHDIGPCYRAMGQISTAIACYEDALAIFAEIHDPVHQALTQMNLGVVYVLNGQPTQALKLFDLAQPVFRSTSDRLNLALLLNNRGMAHQRLAQWKQAEKDHSESAKILRRLGSRLHLVNVLEELGIVQRALGQHQTATTTLTDALNQLELIQDEASTRPLRERIERYLDRLQSSSNVQST
ncbi:tetratricopeptide repeat protein [Chloroflexi bacterium TSY]|nr:tetratricopeptide repeat protein [Chloroflexi bacterium TSY]